WSRTSTSSIDWNSAGRDIRMSSIACDCPLAPSGAIWRRVPGRPMLDLERMVRAGAAGAGGSPVILAAPYDLSETFCRTLAATGLIKGYVATEVPSAAGRDVPIAGWWTNRRGRRWVIQKGVAATIIFLGASGQVGGHMLLAAQRAGIRTILLVDRHENPVRKLHVRSTLARRSAAAIARKLVRVGMRRRGAAEASTRCHDVSYENAFNDLYHLVRDRLRLSEAELIGRRVLIVSGSLGPGGAERQIAHTAAGITAEHSYEVIVGCDHL